MAVGDHSLLVEAFFLRRPDENGEEFYKFLLGRNGRMYGMAFSVEPGIYLAGRHGARIEDIVVCGDDGAERMNHAPRDLVVLEG